MTSDESPCLHCLVVALIKGQIAARGDIDGGEIIGSLLQVIGEVIAYGPLRGPPRETFIAATGEELSRRIKLAIEANPDEGTARH